jgi:hypothetical protein
MINIMQKSVMCAKFDIYIFFNYVARKWIEQEKSKINNGKILPCVGICPKPRPEFLWHGYWSVLRSMI